MMNVALLAAKADYEWALSEVEWCFNHRPSRARPRATALTCSPVSIEAYENEHHPLNATRQVTLFHFAIEDMGRSATELTRSSARARGHRKSSRRARSIRPISDTSCRWTC